MTIGRYSHATLAELGQAVEKLPALSEADTLPFPDQRLILEALAGIGMVLLGALLAPPLAPPLDAPGDSVGRAGTKTNKAAM